MDHALNNDVRDEEPLKRIVDALGAGIVLVDANGQIIWMDASTRRRIDGGLQALQLPLQRPDEGVLDGFVTPVEVAVGGERISLCVIQEREHKEPEHDLMAAIQAVLADTSWFTRTVLDKLKALRQARQPDEARPSASEADVLSRREREVLGLICEGRSDGEMSAILQLSPNTVRNHIVSLYRKIGVNRRSAAIIWARERGITSLDVVTSKRREPRMQEGSRQ